MVQGRIRVGLDPAGAGEPGHGLGPEQVEVLLPAGAVVPHGQEHDGHGPHRLPPQEDGAVLPVAEPHPAVDILVRQVHPPGEAPLPIDDAQLPVVPVVHPQGQHRDQPVEHPALDAPGRHLVIISAGQGEHAAEVVIDQPHLHPGGGLPLQDVQDGVPALPLLEDEILQEDVTLRLLQLLQHPHESQVAHREIFGPGVGVGGAGGVPLQIADLAHRVLIQMGQPVRLEIPPQHLVAALRNALHLPTGPLRDPVAAQQ